MSLRPVDTCPSGRSSVRGSVGREGECVGGVVFVVVSVAGDDEASAVVDVVLVAGVVGEVGVVVGVLDIADVGAASLSRGNLPSGRRGVLWGRSREAGVQAQNYVARIGLVFLWAREGAEECGTRHCSQCWQRR